MKGPIALLFLSCTAYGQITLVDSVVEVVPSWKKGEHRSYQATNTQLATKGKDTVNFTSVNYTIDITVVDSSASGYTLSWHYHGFSTKSKDPVARRMMELSENSTVKVVTDKYGTYKGVENWEEIRDRMFKRLDSLAVEFGNLPNFKTAMDLEKERLSTRFGVEQVVMQDAMVYYFYYGRRLKLGRPYRSSASTSVPWSTRQVETLGTMTFNEYNSREGWFQFNFNMRLDKDQFAEARYEDAMKISNRTKLPSPAPEKFLGGTNNTELVTRLGRSGWVTSCSNVMEMTSEDQYMSQELIMRLKR